MTLKQVAQRVGTSVGTVSVVLNNKQGNIRISEATRQAILAAARELGYTPNIAARRLRQGGNSMVIALVWTLDNRFSLLSRVLSGVQEYFEAEHPDVAYELIIVTYRPGQLSEVIGRQIQGQYHGVIIGNSTPEDDRFLENTDLPIPVVRFQRTSKKFPTVNSDGARAGADVADYLVGLGHRRVGLVYPDVASDALMVRRIGFLERMKHHGVMDAVQIAYGPFSEAGGTSATHQLLESHNRPSAIFCPADSMVLGSLYAARRLGLSVPRDVSVIGFDDTDRSAFYDPPLTTVRVPVDRMAAEATRLLMDQMQRRLVAPATTWFPCELIVRESCTTWEG